MKTLTVEVPILRIELLRITLADRPAPVPAVVEPTESTTFGELGDTADDVLDVVRSPFWSRHRRR